MKSMNTSKISVCTVCKEITYVHVIVEISIRLVMGHYGTKSTYVRILTCYVQN